MSVPGHLVGLLDDAAVFPPGDAPLPEALAAHVAHREQWYADLVASFVCRDTDAGGVSESLPLSVVVTGGAGAIAGACTVAGRHGRVHGVEIALRDLDDLAGNARRVVAAVDAARGDGVLAEDVPVFVEIPAAASEHGWRSAADEVSTAQLRLKLRTGGLEEHQFPAPTSLAAWIDAALDRETPFKCTAGLHRAVRHTDADDGFAHHGFLNVLLATRRAFEGAGIEAVVATLVEQDPGLLLDGCSDVAVDLAEARRWFTSFGTCSVADPLDDLIALELVEKP